MPDLDPPRQPADRAPTADPGILREPSGKGRFRGRKGVIERREVEAGGLSTEYLSSGGGDPVVFLHGLGESSASWRPVMSRLAGSHALYAPSLPGHGDSAKPQADYTFEFLAKWLEQFLDAVELPRVTLVGGSMGGLTVLRLALAAPGRVSAVVLVDSIGLGRAIHPVHSLLSVPGLGELAAAWAQTPLGAWQRPFFRTALMFADPLRVPLDWFLEQRRLAQVPGAMDRLIAANRALAGVHGQRIDLREHLAKLTVPTLVVWGADDRIVPVRQAREAIEHIPDGRLVVLPDCGHVPHLEDPERFAEALEEFIDERVTGVRGAPGAAS